jgi:hypothetical protein
LSPDHPEIARSLEALADARAARESIEDAEPLYAHALAIRERALIPEHRKTRALREKLLAVRSRLA